ncbi:MAG: hypothetical protein RMM28_09340 [Thermoleophilia bacterium]|nr:hypothetical protein [Gaiellaceae bacterium]MDW8339329.1 hypothetical protein [Thermoleophilia bacterium]
MAEAVAPSSQVRLEAREAVELDPVRRAERLADVRLAAAVLLAPRLELAEALLVGVPCPAARLEPVLVSALGLERDVVLDEELAWRALAHGPFEPAGGAS